MPTPSHGRFVIVTQVTILSPGLIALKIKHSVGGLCSNRQDHVLKRKEMTKKKSLDDVFSIPIHLLPPHAYTYTTSGSLFLLYCKDDFPEVFLSCKDFLQAGEKKKKKAAHRRRSALLAGIQQQADTWVTCLVMCPFHGNWLISTNFCHLSSELRSASPLWLR